MNRRSVERQKRKKVAVQKAFLTLIVLQKKSSINKIKIDNYKDEKNYPAIYSKYPKVNSHFKPYLQGFEQIIFLKIILFQININYFSLVRIINI